MADLTYTSPCKFNPYLEVGELRPDGYHETLTVLEPVFLHDTLTAKETEGAIKVTSDHPGLPTGPENIVYRAVALLREEAGVEKGIAIHIAKRVPVAAGLGGGSANAAVTLRELDRFWGLNLAGDVLLELAARLGSDVPFFLDPRTSLGRGRGERLTVLPPLPPLHLVIINPAFPVSTRWAYSEIDKKGLSSSPRPEFDRFIEAVKKGDSRAVGSLMYNSFQEVVAESFPPIGEILDFLNSGGVLGAVLAGSGPTVVGVVEKVEEAERLAEEASRVFPENYFVAAATNRWA